MWLTKEDYQVIAPELRRAYQARRKIFMAIRRARKNRLAASAWACYASMIFIAGRSDVRMPNSV